MSGKDKEAFIEHVLECLHRLWERHERKQMTDLHVFAGRTDSHGALLPPVIDYKARFIVEK